MSHQRLRRLASASLVLAVLSGAAGRARASPAAASLCGSGPVTLRIFLVDQAGTAPEVIAVARREADAIWAAAGMRLVWLEPPAVVEPAAGLTIVVIVRTELRRAGAAFAASPSKRPALGWVPFGSHGRPANLVEVSLDAITSVVLNTTFVGGRVGDLPASGQRPLLGRAIGRVVAHELGHWLAGREHAESGLMKEALRAAELIDADAPPLPRRWIADGALRLLTRSSRCEAPLHASLK